jgi:hypothetical protein
MRSKLAAALSLGGKEISIGKKRQSTLLQAGIILEGLIQKALGTNGKNSRWDMGGSEIGHTQPSGMGHK